MIVGTCVKDKGLNFGGIDGICILKENNQNYIILIANYRPPVDRFCLEMVGGYYFIDF